jgi:hypothetical protein
MEFVGHECKSEESLLDAMTMLAEESFNLVLADPFEIHLTPEQIISAVRGVAPRAMVMILEQEASSATAIGRQRAPPFVFPGP